MRPVISGPDEFAPVGVAVVAVLSKVNPVFDIELSTANCIADAMCSRETRAANWPYLTPYPINTRLSPTLGRSARRVERRSSAATYSHRLHVLNMWERNA